MRCRRSRVTELWSRGRRRGRGPGGGGSRPVRVRTAQHCGESWGCEGLAHLRLRPTKVAPEPAAAAEAARLAPPTLIPSQRWARTPRAQPIREHLAKFPPPRRLPATRLVIGKRL